MTIGLIDVDGHNFPNLALMKLSAYHKSMGDHVEWYDIFGEYDRVYMAKVFTHTPDYTTVIPNAKEIVRGGTGYDIKSRLPEQAEKIVPDYSLYPYIDKKTAYGFLTRGCIRKCPWCIVPKKEGTIAPYQDVDELAVDGRTNLILMDNNILAAGEYGLQQLRKIAERGYRIDFNQAMDARLVTDEIAELLARIKWLDSNRIRFGCDTPSQIHDCERAIALIDHHGFKGQYFLYTMIGGKSDYCESYNRVMYWWNRNVQVRKTGRAIYPYAQPYLDFSSKKQDIPMWQKDMAQWANKKMFFDTMPFDEFKPRKNFMCVEYTKEHFNSHSPCPLHFPDYSMTYEQALASHKNMNPFNPLTRAVAEGYQEYAIAHLLRELGFRKESAWYIVKAKGMKPVKFKLNRNNFWHIKHHDFNGDPKFYPSDGKQWRRPLGDMGTPFYQPFDHEGNIYTVPSLDQIHEFCCRRGFACYGIHEPQEIIRHLVFMYRKLNNDPTAFRKYVERK